VGTGMFLIRCL